MKEEYSDDLFRHNSKMEVIIKKKASKLIL